MSGRAYKSSPKHKQPKGWGSLCPPEVHHLAQGLLDVAVPCGKSLYVTWQDWAFRANADNVGAWHGFPIPWRDLPVDAVRQLIAAGRLTEVQYRRALRRVGP